MPSGDGGQRVIGRLTQAKVFAINQRLSIHPQHLTAAGIDVELIIHPECAYPKMIKAIFVLL